MNTDKITSETIDKIIARATVGIDQVVCIEDEIYFPGLYRYVIDEETGKLIQCPND